MTMDLLYLKEIFERLRQGYYITHEDGDIHIALCEKDEDYRAYFSLLGLDLIRHERDFFYFKRDANDASAGVTTLPAIVVFAFILIESVANEGRAIDEYILTHRFSLAELQHLKTDRYKEYLKLVGIEDHGTLFKVVKSMARYGWVEISPDDSFRFLRPFHRLFDKCQEISQEMGESFTLARTTDSNQEPE